MKGFSVIPTPDVRSQRNDECDFSLSIHNDRFVAARVVTILEWRKHVIVYSSAYIWVRSNA
jgi:hypothetical protein